MKKSILALLLVVVLVAVLIVTVIPGAKPKPEVAIPEHEAGKASHCECAGVKKDDHENCNADVKWQPVGTWTELVDVVSGVESGYFYLTADIKASDTVPITNVDVKVVICYNGHTITRDDGDRLFINLGELTFTNCQAEGGIIANPAADKPMVLSYGGSKINVFGGTITINGEGGCFYMNAYDSKGTSTVGSNGQGPATKDNELNLYGGTLKRTVGSRTNVTTGSECIQMVTLNGPGIATFNMYDGTIDGTKVVSNNPLVYGRSGTSVINIAGGTIKNGYATLTPTNNAGNLYSQGLFTMSGGTISDGKASNWGGNVYCREMGIITGGNIINGEAAMGGNIYSPKILTISGGTISGGTATGTSDKAGGGNILAKGMMNIEGGTIKNGTSANHGGNFYALNGGWLTISGGNFIGGVSGNGGGNLFSQSTTLITGGIFEGGSAENGGNIDVDAPGTLRMTGATLKNGHATRGGNLYVSVPNAVITKCTFIGGAASIGGDIATSEDLTIEDCTIEDCTFEDGAASLAAVSMLPAPRSLLRCSWLAR